VDVFHAEVTKRLADITTIRKASKILVKAFMEAHTRILQGPISVSASGASCDLSPTLTPYQWQRGIQDIWEAGTTTLLGGLVLRVHNQRAPYVFVCASVGDCKAFHISISDGYGPSSSLRNESLAISQPWGFFLGVLLISPEAHDRPRASPM